MDANTNVCAGLHYFWEVLVVCSQIDWLVEKASIVMHWVIRFDVAMNDKLQFLFLDQCKEGWWFLYSLQPLS